MLTSHVGYRLFALCAFPFINHSRCGFSHWVRISEELTFICSIVRIQPMASALRVETDPMGDVILLLEMDLWVFAHHPDPRVLSLASPVFAAMLGNRWLGDKSLSTTEPTTIPLPNDHIGAITRLCRVLHYQCDMNEPIEFNTFENLALLCHKYDFGRAILPWTNFWIERFRLRRHWA